MRKLVKSILMYGNCVKCGAIYSGSLADMGKMKISFSIDHIHEKADGGGNKDNKQFLCNDCHAVKSKMSILKRIELNRPISREEALELNEKFLKNKFVFAIEVMSNGKRIKKLRIF